MELFTYFIVNNFNYGITVNSLKQGINFGLYSSGKVRYITNYKNGKRNGLCKNWNKNGKLTRESHFKNGKIIRQRKWICTC